MTDLDYRARGHLNWVYDAEAALKLYPNLRDSYYGTRRQIPGWVHVAGDHRDEDQEPLLTHIDEQIKAVSLSWYIAGHGDGWREGMGQARSKVDEVLDYATTARAGWFILTMTGWGLALLGWLI